MRDPSIGQVMHLADAKMDQAIRRRNVKEITCHGALNHTHAGDKLAACHVRWHPRVGLADSPCKDAVAALEVRQCLAKCRP